MGVFANLIHLIKTSIALNEENYELTYIRCKPNYKVFNVCQSAVSKHYHGAKKCPVVQSVVLMVVSRRTGVICNTYLNTVIVINVIVIFLYYEQIQRLNTDTSINHIVNVGPHVG